MCAYVCVCVCVFALGPALMSLCTPLAFAITHIMGSVTVPPALPHQANDHPLRDTVAVWSARSETPDRFEYNEILS